MPSVFLVGKQSVSGCISGKELALIKGLIGGVLIFMVYDIFKTNILTGQDRKEDANEKTKP